MDKTKRVADYLADGLYMSGCRYAFGMPGGEVLSILDAFRGSGIEFVLCKHENNGGHMAEGIYQRTGSISALLATIGPGATNIVNVVANAKQERVPLLVITGCVDQDVESYYTHQVLDHQAIFAEVTKASFKLHPATADTIVDKAIKIATTGQPGPVHIDVPVGVADIKVKPSLIKPTARPSPMAPAPGKDLLRAKELLANSSRPLLIAGIDAVNQNAEHEIRRFVKRYRVPIITTYKAKGIVPEDDALSLGGAGLSLKSDSILFKLIKQSDLIIGAGFDPIEMRDNWRNVWDTSRVHMIDFTATISNHYMYSSSISFVGDVGAGLNVLSENVEPGNVWDEKQPTKTRRDLQAAFKPPKEWGPGLVIKTVRDAIPKDAIVACDTGAHKLLLSQMWTCYEPRTLLQSNSFSTMAIALPVAIGVQIAEPKRSVIAFTGDCGLLMCLGELSTLRERELPIIIVVFVDSSIALIEKKQRARGFENTGVDFNSVDFVAIAKAFGGSGHDVYTKEQLAIAIQIAKKSQQFCIIACHIPRYSYDGTF
jgi:acetolactate synthase-1/2/3 large subunit